MNFEDLIKSYENCPCGQKHECGINDIWIGSGIVKDVGEILKENGFRKRLLLVADKTTLRVSEGIVESLRDFDLTYIIYEEKRVATMADVKEIERRLIAETDGVIAVGTGSIHDPARLACARKNKPLCLFATAPSMDGFASYSAPIVDGNFKITYPAKCPDVIIADTKILAESPAALKSAGFGDMVAKYIALIDWQVSNLVSGESYCEKVACLTRFAADNAMKIANVVTKNDEESARLLFEGLLYTGIGMSFTKTSRPASGSEHMMAHYIECKELLDGKTPDYHGTDVGICTLIILKLYKSLLNVNSIKAHKEVNDFALISRAYGKMAEGMLKLNTPDTITDNIDPITLEDNFEEIKRIVASVPAYDEIKEKMIAAGCKTSFDLTKKSEELIEEAFEYSPYMRRRLSLRRLLNMTNIEKISLRE